MAWTQAEIDALKASIASGTLSVTYADRSVVYRSMTEMLQALALMEHEVQGSTSGSRLAATSKGV